MKIVFPLPTDRKMHRYCLNCLKDGTTQQIKANGLTKYHCAACGKVNDRTLYFDKHKVWLDAERELWHESVGVFVQRIDGKFLFFQRTEFPFGLTIPAGHVDINEEPAVAAKRELKEETGIKGSLTSIGTSNIIGDSCSAGADAHSWHVFLLMLDSSGKGIEILDEGEKPLWLTLDEAKIQGMAFVIEQVTDKFRNHMES
jgi:8-oxo-dGTP pyrophosphatase MutT (NUDIX family)